MKLFKSTILAALAVGVLSLGACSDDDYKAPAAPDGVFFPNDLPAQFEVLETATSFDIRVCRLGATPQQTYAITSVYDSDVLTIPTEVTFPEGATESVITVQYKPEYMAMGKDFAIKIAFSEADASPAGNRVLEADVILSAPWSDWEDYSIDEREPYGTYNYSVAWIFSGTQPAILTKWRHNTEDPTEFELHLTDWGEGEIANGLKFNVKGSTVTLPPTNTGYDIEFTNGTFRLWVMDYNSYLTLRNPNAQTDPASVGTFDAEKGLFRFRMVYAVDVNGEMYAQAEGWESYQMDGYPDYSFTCEYQGLTTNADATDSYATFMTTVASGITEAHFAISTTQTVDELIAALKAGTVTDYAMVNAGEEQTFTLPLSGSGDYVLAGVAFDEEGNVVNQLSSTFSISTGISEWRKAGTAQLIDAWITACWSLTTGSGEKVTYEDLGWEIDVLESVKEPKVYALVHPWCDDDWVFRNKNFIDDGIFTKVNLILDCTDPECVLVKPQYSGYTMKAGSADGMTEDYVYNVANEGGYAVAEEGLTKDQVKAQGLNDKIEGNVIVIKHPMVDFDERGWLSYKEDSGIVGRITCDFLEAADAQAAPAKVRKSSAATADRFMRLDNLAPRKSSGRIFTLRTDL